MTRREPEATLKAHKYNRLPTAFSYHRQVIHTL